MGAHSTLYLSREKALGVFLNLSVNMSNEKLERLLDQLLEDRLYRVCIDCGNEDDKCTAYWGDAQ